MDWQQGYASRWRVDRIDPATWEPCETIGGIEDVTIESDGTDAAPLLETAGMTVTRAALEAFEPGWHRVVMEATQGQLSEAVDLGTVWLDVDNSTYDRGYRQDKLGGRSTLHQAADAPIGDGQYAPKGADGAAWAGERLSTVIDAPVHVEGSYRLADHIVFDLDASVLEAVWDVLRAGDYIIQLDGRGEAHIMPMPTVPALSVDRSGACIFMPKVTRDGAAATYTREWAPDVHPFSLVYCAIPERGLDGLHRVLSQKLTCKRGVTVEETVEVIA